MVNSSPSLHSHFLPSTLLHLPLSLADTARLRVDEKYLLPSLTLGTPLEYLIPTTTGAGACTTALTDFLVLTHNNFIEKCRGIVMEQYKR